MDILKVWGRIPSQHLGLLIVAGVISTLLPSAVRTHRVLSFSKPLTIHTPKAEPPRVAFDLLIGDAKSFETDNEWSLLNKQNPNSISLVAGEHRFAGKSGIEMLQSQKVVLQPMVFSHQDAQKSLDQFKEDREWMANLPPEEQKRLSEANAKYGTLNQDWTPPSFHDLAEEKIREYKGSPEAQDAYRSGKVFVSATNSVGDAVTPDSIHTADVQTKPAQSLPLVTGNIRYTDPLPSGPNWRLAVNHFQEGVRDGSGTYIGNGKYEIPIGEKSGTIVASLQDRTTGQIIGEGTLRLSEMISANPTIEIHKSTSQMSVNLSSFYNHSQSLVGPSTNKDRGASAAVFFASLDHKEVTDQLGTAQIDQIQNGSFGLVRTQSQGYYPGIFIAQSGDEKRWPLFPATMIEALKKIVRDQQRFSQYEENGSIVWGQVVRDGKPVDSAEVTVESDEGYQPIYLNSLMIPDPTMRSTSDNGYFVIMNLDPGLHSLLAKRAGTYLAHSNVVTDEDAVSVANMDSSMITDAVRIRSFDAFNGSPQPVTMEIQSSDEAIDIGRGVRDVSLPVNHELSLATVHATSTEYLDTTLVYDQGSDHIHAPMIKANWLTRIQEERKINIDPNRGTVIGFVQSENFDVYLPNDAEYSADQIVYFDVNGFITDHGVAGGGFILFNVKTGVQSVVVGDKNSEMLQTKVLPVDTQVMTTLNFQ